MVVVKPYHEVGELILVLVSNTRASEGSRLAMHLPRQTSRPLATFGIDGRRSRGATKSKLQRATLRQRATPSPAPVPVSPFNYFTPRSQR